MLLYLPNISSAKLKRKYPDAIQTGILRKEEKLSVEKAP